MTYRDPTGPPSPTATPPQAIPTMSNSLVYHYIPQAPPSALDAFYLGQPSNAAFCQAAYHVTPPMTAGPVENYCTYLPYNQASYVYRSYHQERRATMTPTPMRPVGPTVDPPTDLRYSDPAIWRPKQRLYPTHWPHDPLPNPTTHHIVQNNPIPCSSQPAMESLSPATVPAPPVNSEPPPPPARGSPANDRRPVSSARSNNARNSQQQQYKDELENIEDEVSFLHDECATINIMLDSLRNAFLAPTWGGRSRSASNSAGSSPSLAMVPQGPISVIGASLNDKDIDREMSFAFDDVALQVKQLQRKVDLLESRVRELALQQPTISNPTPESRTEDISEVKQQKVKRQRRRKRSSRDHTNISAIKLSGDTKTTSKTGRRRNRRQYSPNQ
ncbi:uncharacterized protein BYT42DRAFT_615712 [Radiomyces spectabilis]|uniref:uncharacterized protein n=1 Tax=Radiomyces spectabilis TaxID=64574 RepID=UPI00221EAE82|nr:uncharacterized protein BYT42DRAFT_615712 [Radiomyces spectabilis]KAI8374563.1 hypothetical protein BYT42DRAFT_615712 [Radiomyces spectabilis]